MGGGGYDIQTRSVRAASSGFHTKSAREIFSSKIHESMSPMNLRKRECFDNADHPNAVPIILGLDVTGSMGRIPHDLVKDGLPHLMTTLISKGVPDATVCFVAIGDHLHDKAPLQVGQFEASDEALDLFLTRTWIEEGGGGNDGESYPLAWLFAARHTETDAWNKRGKKGFLFTIGDEPFHTLMHKAQLEDKVFGKQGYEADLRSTDLLNEAREKYEVFHIALGGADSRWKEALGDHLLICKDEAEIPNLIASTVIAYSHAVTTGVTGSQPQGSDEPKKEDKIKITL